MYSRMSCRLNYCKHRSKSSSVFDEVWNIKQFGVVLATMVILQHSSFDVPQDKAIRQVDLEGCGLLSVQVPYDLWKGGRCHLMECKVVPLLYMVAGRLLCTDGLSMLSIQRSVLWALWQHVWSNRIPHGSSGW